MAGSCRDEPFYHQRRRCYDDDASTCVSHIFLIFPLPPFFFWCSKNTQHITQPTDRIYSRTQNTEGRARILVVCHVKLVLWHMIPAHLINKKAQIADVIPLVRNELMRSHRSRIQVRNALSVSRAILIWRRRDVD